MILISPSAVVADVQNNSPVFGSDTVVSINNITATTSNADYPITNVANDSTNLYWKSSTLAVQTIEVDNTGNLDNCDYIGVASHNLFSAGCYIKAEIVLIDNSVEVIANHFIPSSNDALIFRFSPKQVKTFRLVLTPAAVHPKIAVLFCGKLVVSPRKVYVGHTPLNLARDFVVSTGFSENGQFLGRVVTQQSYSTSMSLQNLSAAWVRSALIPFVEQTKDRPFFVAWRPYDYPLETGYVWLTAPLRPINQRNNGMMNVDLQYKGVM